MTTMHTPIFAPQLYIKSGVTNIDFYTKVLGDEFDDYPLWIAHYYQPGKPRIKRSWVFWQHSEEGRVNGIKSKVDFNVFNGDSTDFKNLLID